MQQTMNTDEHNSQQEGIQMVSTAEEDGQQLTIPTVQIRMKEVEETNESKSRNVIYYGLILLIILIVVFGTVLLIYFLLNNRDNEKENNLKSIITPSPTMKTLEMLPIPGELFEIDNQSHFTLNETVKFIQNSTSLKCMIETDGFGNLSNTSYIEIDENTVPDIEIGDILLIDEYLYNILPSNCTQYPALTIYNIIKTQSILTLFVKEAFFWEYITEMDVNMSNLSVIDNGNIDIENQTLYKMEQVIEKYNLSNVTETEYIMQCWNISDNGTKLNIINTSSSDGLCGDSTIMDTFGSIYGDVFNLNDDDDDDIVHNRRRRMFFKKLFKWVATPIKKVVNGVVNFVDTVIDIIKGDVNERVFEIGINLSKNYKYDTSGSQPNGEYSISAGVDFKAVTYADLIAKYKIFSSFDYFKFVIGAETQFEAYLNFFIRGDVSFKYEIIRKEKSNLIFIAGIPILIKMYAALEVGLDINIETQLSAQIGYKPIFIEFGVEYDPNNGGWNSISNSNLQLIPYKKFSGNLLNNSSSCIESSITPSITLLLGVVFYEFIDINLQFPFSLNTQFSWPSTCDNSKSKCNYNIPQLKTSINIDLQISIGLKIGISKLGLPTIDNTFKITTIQILPTKHICSNFLLPIPIYFLCCPISSTTYNPTKYPTLNPVNIPIISSSTSEPTSAPQQTTTPNSTLTSLFPNITFSYQSNNEDFNGKKINIGWIEYASCFEGKGISHMLTYHDRYTPQYLSNIMKYAIAIKILPSTDIPNGINQNTQYALKTDICSNPVYAFNNEYELSYTLNMETSVITGYSNLNNWIGTSSAKQRLRNWCVAGGKIGDLPRAISSIFYHACGNGDGMHIGTEERCEYDINNKLGHNISIWMGFDLDKTRWCRKGNLTFISPITQTNSANHPTPNSTVSPTVINPTQLNITYIGREYKVGPINKWIDANQYCQDTYGTTLATITSQQDHYNAQSALQEASKTWAWIGLNDLETQGIWQWVDGTNCSYAGGNCKNDPFWNPGEPTGGPERCTYINTANGHYNDNPCYQTPYTLCNYEQIP